MPMPHRASRALPFAVLAAFAVTALTPLAAWADMQVSNDLNTTLGNLSTDTSTANSSNVTAANLAVLQSKIDSLSTDRSTSSYASSQATISALQGIMARLQQGYTITSYTLSTDVSSLVNNVTITFTKDGSTTSFTAAIPPVVTNSDGSSTDAASSSSVNPTDMLTTALQQVGLQMALQMMGGGTNPLSGAAGSLTGAATNPLSSIQNTLNSVVAAATNPTPLSSAATGCSTGSGQTPAPGTAVYDISAGKVYMPDGSVLEAHSGLGNMMDNPAYADRASAGPTPPGVYNLSMREQAYYGVDALRLTPANGVNTYGRDGFLAHTPLVRGTIGSHGCVAFPNYAQFLAAFRNGQIKQLIVVANKAGDGTQQTCTSPTPVQYNVAHPDQ